MKINLHIERLVLDGLPFETQDRAKLQSAIQTELARLLAGDTDTVGLRLGGAVPGVRGGEIRLTAQDGPDRLGRQIAGSIYGGISKAV